MREVELKVVPSGGTEDKSCAKRGKDETLELEARGKLFKEYDEMRLRR